MKSVLYDLYRKYKIILFIFIIFIIIIGIYFFINPSKTISLLELKSDNYIFKYDTSWKIESEENNLIVLKHKSNSKLEIEILDLQEEYRYLSIDELLDDFLYDIEKQNSNYKLISKVKESITKYKYDGYKLLYESDDRQAMVVVCKKGEQLIIFTYDSSSDYFDILLDSVNSIIYDFNTVDNNISLTHNLNLDMNEIIYEDDNSINSLLNEQAIYEIATNNYYVKFMLPDNFTPVSFNSTFGQYKFQELKDKRIDLNVSLYNINIYEYLDKSNSLNIYSKWDYYKKHDDYSDFNESINKFSSNYESYIYKNKFYYTKALSFDSNSDSKYKNSLRENIVLVYALDKNHILIFEISSSDVSIPEKLINMIEISEVKNYSSYINSKKENGYLLSTLKRYSDYSKDNVEEITLRVPDKYIEIDKENNIYEHRYYTLGYNEKLNVNNYEIEYSVLSGSFDDLSKRISNTFSNNYGDCNYLTYSSDKKINGKNFKIYDGGYTQLSGIMFTNRDRIKYYTNVKVLYYELSNNYKLLIQIEGNDSLISDEILNDLTNFEIKQIKKEKR